MSPMVALWQCAPAPRQPQVNAERLVDAARKARAEGAELLITPELTLTGYNIGTIEPDLTEGALETISDTARAAGIALVAGIARHDARGQLRNSSAIVDRRGSVLALYDKAHLFGDLDRERFVAGETSHAIAQVAGLRVATIICYDVEHPEPCRAAALDGAELIAIPTANMAPFVEVNRLVVPTRAWEDTVAIGYANHCGREGETAYLGESLLAGPDGSTTVAGDSETILIGSVEPRRGAPRAR